MACQLGLTAEVQRSFSGETRASVIALDVHSRSTPVAQAVPLIQQATQTALACQPGLIYKKIDSVLRGHVLAETQAMLQVTGKTRALVLSANPSRRRVIRQGRYYLEDQLLDQTVFARDPEFPACTSDVLELLGTGCRLPVVSLRSRDPAPAEGIVVPDVSDASDLDFWSAQVDERTLPVGGAEFFAALLKQLGLDAPSHYPNPTAALAPIAGATLYVCGSPAAWDHGRDRQCAAQGIPVVSMPEDLFQGSEAPELVSSWTGALGQKLSDLGQVMAAIGRPSTQLPPGSSARLCHILAKAIAPLLSEARIGRVLIEGGATATAVLETMQWTRLDVGQSLAPGLAPMHPLGRETLEVWIKPGSYPWPGGLL